MPHTALFSPRRIALVVCTAVLLAACAGGDDGAAPSSTTTTPDVEAGTEGVDDGTTTTEGASSDEPDEEAAEPIAGATVPIDFIDGGELDVDVMSFEISGELLRVVIRFTAAIPLGADEVAIGAVIGGDENAPAAGVRPELIDTVNLKAYEVVTGGIPLGVAIYLMDGAPRTVVCYYAAPQDDIDKLDIRLSSQLPTLTDVPYEP